MEDYFCPQCGKAVQDKTGNCPHCDAVVQERPDETPIGKTPLTSGGGYYPFIILAVLGALVLAAFFLGGGD